MRWDKNPRALDETEEVEDLPPSCPRTRFRGLAALENTLRFAAPKVVPEDVHPTTPSVEEVATTDSEESKKTDILLTSDSTGSSIQFILSMQHNRVGIILGLIIIRSRGGDCMLRREVRG